MPTPNNALVDNGFSTATQHGQSRFFAPFDGDNTNYVLEEDYVISLASYASVALNTAHPVYGTYFLVNESVQTPTGVLDVVKWTRTYAQVPATRSEPSSVSYNFIGYDGYVTASAGTITTNVQGRKRFMRSVTSRIQYDYFMVGAGLTYTTFQAIPTIPMQLYYMRQGNIAAGGGSGVWTATYTLGSPDDIAQGNPVDKLVDISGPYETSIVPCVPSRTQYMAMITAKAEIVQSDSKLSRWKGDIYVRETTYIIAQ